MSKEQPIQVDLAAGPCPHCAEFRKQEELANKGNFTVERVPGPRVRVCNGCGKPIPVYVAMGGSGFQSPEAHHFHAGNINGIPAWLSVTAELCAACYLNAFREAYPGHPDPVLMKEVVHG